MTVNQCAQELGVVSHTIRKWIWAGQIHAEKIRKGREQWTYLIRVEDWQRFLATRANSSLPNSEPTTSASRLHLRTDYFMPDEVEAERTRRGDLMAAALNGCQQSRRILRHGYQLSRWYRADIGEIL